MKRRRKDTGLKDIVSGYKSVHKKFLYAWKPLMSKKTRIFAFLFSPTCRRGLLACGDGMGR